MTTCKAPAKVVLTAQAEIGYLEKVSNSQLEDKTANAGNNNWNKYAAFLDSLGVVYSGKKNGYAWCDCFVDWCFITTFGLDIGMAMTYQPRKGLGAGCTYSMRYYKDARMFRQQPQIGDQIFFTKDGGNTSYHTGLVVDVHSGKVYTIEGNTSSLPGVVENGGCVRNKSYPINAKYIAGYGRPNWSLVEEVSTMTQDEFNKMFKVAMAVYRAELQDNDCGTYSAEGRQWATSTGLIAGGATLSDGNPNYMWQDFLTREQFVTVLHRFAQQKRLA